MSEQTKITGGKVCFGLTICPKQYESKRADAEINFTVAEGDTYEAIFDKATNIAIRRVREMLELQTRAAIATPEKKAVSADSSLFGYV